ncbi:MAG: lycopene cyclase domain-containing protein [Candidatus Nanoarchaeia archaeon]
MEYLIMLLVFLVSGILFLWKGKIKLFNSKKEAILTLGILFIIGVACDSIAVARGYWIFDNVFKFRLGYLPLEEYLFFLVLPIWVIIVYKFINKKLNE